MCGRARLSSDVSQIKIAFGIRPERPTPNIAPRWNLAPTDPAPVVYYDAKHGGRRLEVMRWGLIPLLGEGHQDRFLDHQCPCGRGRHQAGLPRSVPAAAVPRAIG
jgi:putative SOS response-associated peptidase YedK